MYFFLQVTTIASKANSWFCITNASCIYENFHLRCSLVFKLHCILQYLKTPSGNKQPTGLAKFYDKGYSYLLSCWHHSWSFIDHKFPSERGGWAVGNCGLRHVWGAAITLLLPPTIVDLPCNVSYLCVVKQKKNHWPFSDVFDSC